MAKKIRITMDGPYEVSGNVPINQIRIITNADGDSVGWEKVRTYNPSGEPYRLCRCGQSNIKPFCDGSHEDAGFCGKERADRPPYESQAEMQRGPGLGMLDDASLCIGARFCDKCGKTAWNLIEGTDDPENRALAIEEACACPSGRLTAVDADGRHIEPQLEQEISLIEDPPNGCKGPLWVKGGIPVEGAGGEQYEVRNRATLCRCGESQNQPFCDGAHYRCECMQGLDE